MIPWFSKTEGNTYATIAASPFPLQGKPTQAQDVARRISGAVAGEVFAQVKTYQVPITNSSPSHLHYLPFASCFPLPHFTIAVLFAFSFPFASFFVCLFCLFLVCLCVGLLAFFVHLPLCLKLGRLPSIWTIMIIWKIRMLLLKNPLSCILKCFESVVVILLEKGLFKTSLLVPVLYLLWVVLFFIKLVVLRMLSLCL